MEIPPKLTLDIKQLLKQLDIDPDKFVSLCLSESELKENAIQVSVQPVQKQ